MIVVKEKKGQRLIKLNEKRLDILSASKLKERVRFMVQNQHNGNIVLDISSCAFCDASGLSAIVKAHNICLNAGGKLVITGIRDNVRRLINICKLESMLAIA